MARQGFLLYKVFLSRVRMDFLLILRDRVPLESRARLLYQARLPFLQGAEYQGS